MCMKFCAKATAETSAHARTPSTIRLVFTDSSLISPPREATCTKQGQAKSRLQGAISCVVRSAARGGRGQGAGSVAAGRPQVYRPAAMHYVSVRDRTRGAWPVLHASDLGQIWPPRLRPCLLPPQVDAGAIAHPVGADDAAIRRPLARESMFETIPVSGRGNQRTRLVPAILSAVAPAAANSIVEQQSSIRIEVTATDDRASYEILDAFGRPRRVLVGDAGARPCRNGAAVSRPQRPGR